MLAGPSGAGKSRLAERSGLPVLRLDDFYRSAGDPALPLVTEGPDPSRHLVPRLLGTSAGIVDWDHPDSWLLEDAVATIERLCTEGRAEVPVYDIARSARTGTHVLDLGGSALFVAEGIFAGDVVERCRERGLLAAAYCVTQPAVLTFARRLHRDLREHRKPPLVLLRRGLALMRAQPRVVAHAVAAGCEPLTGDQGLRRIRALSWPRDDDDPVEGPVQVPVVEQRALASVSRPLVQPDQRSCGAACLVVARALGESGYAFSLRDPARWRAEVLRTHAEVISLRDSGRLGLPWPRALGTPPWAVARRLRLVTGRPWGLVRPDLVAVTAAVRVGIPVPLYVGSRLLPRHVLLVVEVGAAETAPGAGLRVYDPARGTVRPLEDVLRTGWPRPWCAIVPIAH